MGCKLVCVLAVALALQIIGAARVCPDDPNCVCGGTLAVELNCNIDGRTVKIDLLPSSYINIKCENATSLDYSKLPTCANPMNTFKSVSFKDCPLPSSSFKEVLTNMGVSKTMALIFQNAKNLSEYFDRKHFAGLEDLTKLLLSVNGVSRLPDNLFVDINKLTWLNIRSNTINLSEELFKPLEKLETLEISHNHMTNISSNLFSHLSYLRKLSLWQSNVTWFSKDLFTGVDVLEELDLSSNGLNELPASIFKPLKKLKKLTLFANKFSALPQNLFKHNEELETVVILNNDAKLMELPKNLFGSMENLKQIYIQRSGLEKLPYDLFANSPQITNISLAYNDLQKLPESIFNDQINLLELDLSHNKLDSLEPKLFSSLVRLESLYLNHNRLERISGSTFSPLLSLIHLDMENNQLQIISSGLFSNNKQRMSISLAHNNLSFSLIDMRNNSCVYKRMSPFVHTYNLRLLNLSHNKFRTGFEDWWINGHESLDVSHNYIEILWPEDKDDSYFKTIKKSMKRLWISENPLQCDCINFKFIDYISYDHNTQVLDFSQVQCPTMLWTRGTCYIRFSVMVKIVIGLPLMYLTANILFILYRKYWYLIFGKKVYYRQYSEAKMRFLKNLAKNAKREECDRNVVTQFYDEYSRVGMLLDHDPKDNQFVHEQLMPGFKHYKEAKTVFPKEEDLITVSTNKNKILNCFSTCNEVEKEIPKEIIIVVFSPNYLMSQYKDLDIKKIHSEISEDEHAVYIFVDIENDNSLFTFLKDQHDPRNSVVWNEPGFWEKISELVDVDRVATLYANYEKLLKSLNDDQGICFPQAIIGNAEDFYASEYYLQSQLKE